MNKITDDLTLNTTQCHDMPIGHIMSVTQDRKIIGKVQYLGDDKWRPLDFTAKDLSFNFLDAWLRMDRQRVIYK